VGKPEPFSNLGGKTCARRAQFRVDKNYDSSVRSALSRCKEGTRIPLKEKRDETL
jgi:hypothetical protein